MLPISHKISRILCFLSEGASVAGSSLYLKCYQLPYLFNGKKNKGDLVRLQIGISRIQQFPTQLHTFSCNNFLSQIYHTLMYLATCPFAELQIRKSTVTTDNEK